MQKLNRTSLPSQTSGTMAGCWFILVLGIAILHESVSYSPIPDSLEEEWAQFVERLEDVDYRLPETTVPSHYELSLTPYFDVPEVERQFTFDGSVTIRITATVEDVTEIVMHCNDLIINTASVETTVGVTRDIIVPAAERPCENSTDFLRLQTSEPLQTDQEYIVKFEFRGNIQSGMRGFYRSFYSDSTQRRWMGTTQFQPGHARQAFPCYDEPGFKAYFDITIIRPEDFSDTISNMPIKERNPLPEIGRISETFYTTPHTSTYLLAFIVSHYDKIATNNDAVRPFDIYARNNAHGKGDWALEVGELLLVEMEEFTGFPYYSMQEHLDMKQAAIPDFSAGAMENWGLLTYREALVLYDYNNSNHFYKQRVANIISHEITHMWFGNLVTCAWWDNLWLNEGFARFYQYFLTDEVADLGYSTRFITEQLHVAMFSDSVDSAHPLTDPSVSDATSVSNHFSTITYARGACILRMTQYLLGKETYRKGIQTYLRERAFNVAEPHHLFDALDRAAVEDNALAAYGGITIDRYFRTWSEKAGHPLLTVTVNHATGEMSVVQARWERNTGISTHTTWEWDIPITWTRAGAPDFDDLKPSQFLTAHATYLNRGTTGLEWVIFNKQESGFYRVNYDDTTWALITRTLRNADRTVIHEYNRAMIINDVFSLARAGTMRYERAYNIISFLQYEDQYAPWLAAIDGFSFIRRRLAHDSDNLTKLHERIAELSQAVVARLGYNDLADEPYMDGLLRMYVMEFLCDVEHEGCVAAAQTNFASWKDGGFLRANMRPWVYCEGLRKGTSEDFDLFWERYLIEDLASEQVVMLTAAGCTNDEGSLIKFLNAVVADTDDVRPQDLSTAFNNAVSGNEDNTLKVFRWIQSNPQAVIDAFGSLQSPLNTVAGRLLREADILMFETWVDANRNLMSDTVYNSVRANANAARNNLRWSEERVGEMTQYLEMGYVEEAIDELDDSSEEETESPPTEEGSDEDGDDSANIAALSLVTMMITLSINYVL